MATLGGELTVTAEPRGRALIAGSLILSALGLALLIWWLLGIHRWWVLGAGALAGVTGGAIAARARREPEEPPEDAQH